MSLFNLFTIIISLAVLKPVSAYKYENTYIQNQDLHCGHLNLNFNYENWFYNNKMSINSYEHKSNYNIDIVNLFDSPILQYEITKNITRDLIVFKLSGNRAEIRNVVYFNFYIRNCKTLLKDLYLTSNYETVVIKNQTTLEYPLNKGIFTTHSFVTKREEDGGIMLLLIFGFFGLIFSLLAIRKSS